jgi:predicted DNA-binding protein (UPF0251 family)
MNTLITRRILLTIDCTEFGKFPRKSRHLNLTEKEMLNAKAVKLVHVKGIKIKDVAESLDIHPFTLSRRIKEVREGKIVAFIY